MNIPIEYDTYKLSNEHQLRRRMNRRIDELQAFIKLYYNKESDKGKCRVMLQHYGWNEALLKEALHKYSPTVIEQRVKLTKGSMNRRPARICLFCHIEMKQFNSLECGHSACAQCWKRYFLNQFDKQVTSIECGGDGCDLVFCDEKIAEIINMNDRQRAPRYFSEFEKWKLHNYRICNRILKCPRLRCPYIGMPDDAPRKVQCKCGDYHYWKLCCPNWHAPLPCLLWQEWLNHRELGKYDEGLILMGENTKLCPLCRRPIERNGGCLQMECLICHCQFCWECGESWNHTNFYYCPAVNNRPVSRQTIRKPNIFTGQKYEITYKYYRQSGELRRLERPELQAQAEENEQRLKADLILSRIEHDFLEKAVESWVTWTESSRFMKIFHFFLKRSDEKFVKFAMKDLEDSIDDFIAKLSLLHTFLHRDLNDLANLLRRDRRDYKEEVMKVLAELSTAHEIIMGKPKKYKNIFTFII